MSIRLLTDLLYSGSGLTKEYSSWQKIVSHLTKMTKLLMYTSLIVCFLYIVIHSLTYSTQAGSLITQSMLGKLVEEGVLICRVYEAAELNTYCIQARSLIRDSKLDKLLFQPLLLQRQQSC